MTADRCVTTVTPSLYPPDNLSMALSMARSAAALGNEGISFIHNHRCSGYGFADAVSAKLR